MPLVATLPASNQWLLYFVGGPLDLTKQRVATHPGRTLYTIEYGPNLVYHDMLEPHPVVNKRHSYHLMGHEKKWEPFTGSEIFIYLHESAL